MKRQMIPNGFETEHDHANGNVALSFSQDGGERWTVVLPLEQMGQVARGVLEEIGLSSQSPTAAPGDLQIGREVSIRGQEVRPRSAGGAVLILHLELEDGRVVTIPLDLPPRDLSHLVESLNRHR